MNIYFWICEWQFMVFPIQPAFSALLPVFGTFVELLEQQQVKGAVVHNPVHSFEMSSALGAWGEEIQVVHRLYADLLCMEAVLGEWNKYAF